MVGSWVNMGRGGNTPIFELDVRVPMIVSRQPGYDKRFTNATSDALAENVDLFQTIADACGFETAGLNGQSLLPLVDNPKKKGDDAAYSLFPRGKNIMGFTCTDGKFRYSEWWDNKAQKVIELELYLCNDDYSKQIQNFAKDLKYKKVLERKVKLLELQFPNNVGSSYPQNDKAQNSNVKNEYSE